MFWTVLIGMIAFAALFGLACFILGAIIGDGAIVVLGVLLAAGVVTVLVNAYHRLTDQLGRIEEKLDRLSAAADRPTPEQPKRDAPSEL